MLDTFVITEPSVITVLSTTTDVTCNGLSDGNASLTISGGTPGYSEDWGTNNPNSLSLESTTTLLQTITHVFIQIQFL